MLAVLLGVDDGVPGLLVLVPHLLRDSLFGLGTHPLEHGRVLEHRRHDHETHLRAPQVDLLDRHRTPVLIEHRNVVETDIHGVLGVGEVAAEHFSGLHFYGDDVVLGLVQQFDGSPNHLFIRDSILLQQPLDTNINPMEFILAHSRYQRRHFQQAIEICHKMLAANPRDEAAWVLKCQCLIQENLFDELETEEEGIAEMMVKEEAINKFAKAGTSFRGSAHANPIMRPLHSGRLNTGFQRAGTSAGSRAGSRKNMLRTGRIMTKNGVPTTSNGRVLRLATASLTEHGEDFFDSAKADLRKLSQRPSKARLIFNYLFYVEHNIRKSLQLAVFATESNNYEDPWWKLAVGKCYYHLNFLREAEQQLLSSVKHNNNITAYLYLSKIYQKNDSVEKSLAMLQEGKNMHPHEPRLQIAMGRIYDQLNDEEQSHQHYKQALAIENCNTEAVANIASYFFYKDHSEIALKFYQRLIELGYESQEIWNNMALCCFANHQYHLFYPCFERALLQGCDEPLLFADLWYNIGYVYTMLGEFQFATEAYKVALKHHPEHLEALSNLAVIEAKKGNLDAAINYAEKVYREESHFESCFNLSIWYYQSNQLEKANHFNREALKLYPDHAESRQLATRLLRKLDSL